MIDLNINDVLSSEKIRTQYESLLEDAQRANETLENGTGLGADFLGWLDPENICTDAEIEEILNVAEELRTSCEYVISIGIGGSYLGAKAVTEALNSSFLPYEDRASARLLFAGHQISEDYLYELTQLLKGKKFGIINISKSGTTTEPAIAFRILSEQLYREQGEAFAKEHIVAITDAHKGALRTLADKRGYKSFVIPESIGGRFSVLTAVGLLPIAVAGYDVKALLQGAARMHQKVHAGVSPQENISLQYATLRNALYRAGKKVEIVANYHPKMHYVGEWWKQLYGESEGKDGKGLFNAAVDLTTDLHSLGQWIQEGERHIFETVISIRKPQYQMQIPSDDDNLDGLNYIADKRIDEVNKKAEEGTCLAHLDGGVPVIRLSIDALDEAHLGALFYFFERAVGISGYLLGVNPFNQPGVEKYKSNMFALLNKPGYEEDSKKIQERLSQKN